MDPKRLAEWLCPERLCATATCRHHRRHCGRLSGGARGHKETERDPQEKRKHALHSQSTCFVIGAAWDGLGCGRAWPSLGCQCQMSNCYDSEETSRLAALETRKPGNASAESAIAQRSVLRVGGAAHGPRHAQTRCAAVPWTRLAACTCGAPKVNKQIGALPGSPTSCSGTTNRGGACLVSELSASDLQPTLRPTPRRHHDTTTLPISRSELQRPASATPATSATSSTLAASNLSFPPPPFPFYLFFRTTLCIGPAPSRCPPWTASASISTMRSSIT